MIVLWVCLSVVARVGDAPSASPRSALPGVVVAQEQDEGRRRREGLRDMIRRPAAVPRRPGMPGTLPDTTDDDADQQQAPTPAPPPTPARPPPTGGPALPTPGVVPQNDNELDFEERAKKGRFSFDFAKADIVDIVKAISDMTRRNFIIPEDLKSKKVTILSPTKITAAEAYQVFLAALEVNGITIVRAGKFYKLLPAKDAIKEPVPTCIAPNLDDCPKYSEQMVTLILPLSHVDGNQLLPVVKGLLSKESESQLFAPTNALIVSEYAHNLTRVRRIIEALDVPGFQDELQIVQIQYATASEISEKLQQIFEIQRAGAPQARGPAATARARIEKGETAQAGAAGDETGEVQISKIVPDDRTNQLIIKANRRSFDAIRRLIAKLDIPVSDAEGGRVHVYYLENASAEDLSSTLSSLASGSQPRTQQRGTPRTQAQGEPQVARAGGESAVLFEGEVKVTADKATNSLIIVSSGRDFRALSRIIDQLDRPRRQVYVEAAILEVTVGDERSFGLNWHAPARFSEGDLGSTLGGDGTVGFVQSGPFGNKAGGGISPTISPQGLLGVVGGSVVGIVGKGLSIPLGDGTDITVPSFGVVLNWIQDSTNAQILSTPHILTTDNEEASIEVGSKIPFQRGTAIPTNLAGFAGAAGGADATNAINQLSGLGSLFSSVDRIDVSLKLTLTPQINERGKIKLEIDQQVEDITGRDQATGQPITANRAAKTVVVVDDQQTVVLGGLMRDRETESETKIPILGDLPIIGWLFKNKGRNTEKVNLLLVLTPYIIRDHSDFQQIFERKVREYEEFAAEYYGDTKEYRAYIDYSRKTGPLGKLVQAVRRENKKAENGGAGGGDLIIRPSPSVGGDEPIPVPDVGDVPVPEYVPDAGGEAPVEVPPAEAPPVEAPPAEAPPSPEE